MKNQFYISKVILNNCQKLDWVSFAIQEALKGNRRNLNIYEEAELNSKLNQALELVEDLREVINAKGNEQ